MSTKDADPVATRRGRPLSDLPPLLRFTPTLAGSQDTRDGLLNQSAVLGRQHLARQPPEMRVDSDPVDLSQRTAHLPVAPIPPETREGDRPVLKQRAQQGGVDVHLVMGGRVLLPDSVSGHRSLPVP